VGALTSRTLARHPFLTVAGVAIGVRLLYLLALRRSPFFEVPLVDAETYLTMARAIAGGDLLGGQTVFWQAPLYPYLLALLIALGLDPFGIRLVQFGIGTLTALLVTQLGRRLGGPRVGLLAGMGAALYGPSLFFEGRFLTPTLILCLNTASLLLLEWALRQPGLWPRALAGVGFGLATLARPDAFLIALLLAVGIWALSTRAPRRSALLFLLAALLVTLPVTFRNRFVGGECVWVSSSGGLNYVLGNNPEARETVGIRPGRAWEDLTERPHAEAGLTRAGERSRYFYERAFSYARSDPGGFAALQLRKLWQLVAGYEIPREEDLYFMRRESALFAGLCWRLGTFGFPFGLVAPLGILGAILLWPRRRALSILYLAGLGATLAVVLFFVTGRYRMIAVPIFLLFAALAVDWLCAHWREEVRRRRFFLAGGALAVLSATLPAGSRPSSDAEQWRLLAAAESELQRPEEAVRHQERAALESPARSELHYDLGVYRTQAGDTAGAIAAYRRALDLDPAYGEARLNLGLLLAQVGDYPASVAEILTAAATHPDLGPAQLAAGHAFFHSGAYDSALARYRRAVAVDPKSVEARLAEAAALEELGRSAEAIVTLRRGLAELGERPDLLKAMGRQLKSAGRPAEAVAALKAALLADPADAETHVALGQSYRALGRLAEAEAAQKQALALDPRLAPAHVNLGDVYARRGLYDRAILELERALAIEPDNSAAIYNLAVVHAALGQEPEAILLLERLLAREPDHRAAQHALARLTGEPPPHSPGEAEQGNH
jgi:tetratricopeptide (TPR) repeat protein